MPSNTNTDKQIDNREQASKTDKKFIAFKKRMFWLGVSFLIAAIVLSLLNYIFLETSNNNLGVGIFLFVVLADIFILLPAIITKETNWLALLGSTILCIVFLCLSFFYPFQDFQYRLKVISLVAIVATLLFVLLNGWINAAFFPSKNANIRQSVDFVSNRFAVDVLNVTLILGTLFGTIAFLYFNPDKDNSTFFGGIDIKNVALATAGLVTFFWAAKATKNKSIELEEKKKEFEQRKQEFEEKKRDGKRHDDEIAMAKRRDTAQLIAEASKLLSSENDAQKYAGLSFLNAVASDPKGPLRKEAFDLIADFILTAGNVTKANKVRMRAIRYADDLVGNNPDDFQINEFIQILSLNKSRDYLFNIEIKNLYAVYIGFIVNNSSLLEQIQLKRPNQFAFIDCVLNQPLGRIKVIEINNISAWKCKFIYCKIKKFNAFPYVKLYDRSTEGYIDIDCVPDRYGNNCNFKSNKFVKCDFSDCLSWKNIRSWIENKPGLKDAFDQSYYYSGHEPLGFYKEPTGDLLIEITSKEQFFRLFGSSILIPYSPPADKK
ncbi:phage holin family protein [uncultured Bartonella sp.]|uniref:phage holin family protein n=1 Tax=uncultured Bartonella sp. TaxID=104108 RepID=UPI0025DC9B5F|nr:phage holin family protein [uncultured Bartonella sp.]